MSIDVTLANRQVTQFLDDTLEARALSEKCRDYYDHKQWTHEEIQILQARRQAPIVNNRIRPKVKGLLGLYNIRRTDPRAYPRTPAHEESAHAVTDALRYVADNQDFESTRLDVAEAFFVEGYGGAIVDVRATRRGEPEIQITAIPWDRIYFDPHSRRKDFADARYKGVMMWMDQAEAQRLFPDANVGDLVNAGNHSDETFQDRPRWTDGERRRVRIAQHYYVHDGEWWVCIFSGSTFLVEPQISPYLGEDGEPACPIELVSNVIDRENRRMGEVRFWLDQQDEINHRRSKFLHGMSQRQTHARTGAIADVSALKREMAKPDGHVEWQGDEFGKDFGVIPTSDMSRAQVELYADAKSELDAVSFNAQLAGERNTTLSGRAIQRLQQAGTMEVNESYATLARWENRIYRQVWWRVRQFWTEEKWIRITDDADSLRWVGFNYQVTMAEQLESVINDDSRTEFERRQAALVYTRMMATQDPRLQQPVTTRNPVAELDADIIVDQSFDVVNVQEEQFDALLQFAMASGGQIDVLELLELSQIRGKDEIADKLRKRREESAQAAGNVAQLQAESVQLDNQKTAAETDKLKAQTSHEQQKAVQTQLESALLVNDPARVTSIAL